MSDDCLIVGAGPTGLTLAIELRRFGLNVRLIDKSDHAAQWSQALGVQARTLEQFDRYGIAGKCVDRGRKIPKAQFFSDGRSIATVTFENIPGRFPFVLFLPQSDTERILTEHLRALGLEIERQTELIGFTEDGGIAADLRRADGQVEHARFRWLAGCDGAHSKVRDIMNVPFKGEKVGLSFSLGDLRLMGEDVPGDELVVHLQRGGDVVFIGRLNDDIYRVILALHEQQNSDEQRMPELADFNAAFQKHGIRIQALSAIWRAPFRVNQRKATEYRQGNAFLLGDASHIHSPVGGQGMNTGIQDAANLGWKLAAVANGADESLLDSYNEERGKVGEALLRGTSQALWAATVANPLLEVLRDFVMHEATRLEWVREAIVRGVSETSIEYLGSSIVRDEAHGGPIQAGDRMPDAALGGSDETLLAGLRNAGHLLIARSIPSDEIPRDLQRTTVLELPAGTMEELLGNASQLYLVRPDGYVGFHANQVSDGLRKYAAMVGLLT